LRDVMCDEERETEFVDFKFGCIHTKIEPVETPRSKPPKFLGRFGGPSKCLYMTEDRVKHGSLSTNRTSSQALSETMKTKSCVYTFIFL
jgi:hypothetical protein